MKLTPVLLAFAATGALMAATQAQPIPPPPPAAEAAPATPAAARAPNRPHGFAFRQALQARMVESLHLTVQQRVQAKAIRQRTVAAVKALRADTSLTADQRALKIAAAMQAGHRQFRELLTDEQREKLFRLQRAMRKLQRLLASP